MTTINIQNSGAGAYVIESVGNGAISLIRGNTYYLVINAGGHPFWIRTVPGGYNSNNIYSSGVTNNGTQNGTITFIVPSDAPNTLYYVCQYHSSMQGQINITNPLSPTITNFSIPNQQYSNGGTYTIIPPSSDSPGAFSYTSSDTSIATITGSTVIFLQSGTITITAIQAATNNYASGSTTTSLLIIKETIHRISMGSLYTNNAQVFYKPNSLAPCGIGSVRNSRLKSRKT